MLLPLLERCKRPLPQGPKAISTNSTQLAARALPLTPQLQQQCFSGRKRKSLTLLRP